MGKKQIFLKKVISGQCQATANPGKYLVKLLILLSIAALFAAAVFTGGCSIKNSADVLNANSALDDAQTLTITYSGKDTVISLEDLKQFQVVEKEVPAISKTEGEITRKVKGYLLEDILKKYFGLSLKNLSGLRFSAGDGYAVEVPPKMLQTREIILAFELDGKPLSEDSKPLRSVVPGEFQMYWVKNLTGIEIIEQRAIAAIDRIVFIDSIGEAYPVTDYDYYGSSDKAVRLKDVITSLPQETVSDNVFIAASDGLEKNEKSGTFLSAYLKITGDDSPAFLSEDIPKGMWVKSIYYFLFGNSAYFSVKNGFNLLTVSNIENKDCIKLNDIFKVCGISGNSKYFFKATDDYSIEVDSASIEKGYVYFNDKGSLSVSFEGMPKNTTVKNLLLIKIVE